MGTRENPPAGEIFPLDPAEYGRCRAIWDMDGNREAARRWYRELAEGNRSIFIFRRDDEWLAEIALVRDAGDPDYTIPGRRAQVSRLIVRPEYRRQGIGGVLVDFLVEKARQEGFRELSLGVDDANTAARQLYLKKGFTQVLYEGQDQYGKYKKLLKTL